MKYRFAVAITVFLVLSFWLISCGQDNPVEPISEAQGSPTHYQIKVGENLESVEILDLISKQEIENLEVLQEEAKSLLEQENPELGLALDLSQLESSEEGQMQGGFSLGFCYIYIRGMDYHPLRPCVSDFVNHFHITIKRSSSTPDPQAWSKIHVGKYNQGGRNCFVVYDSQHKWVCVKTCVPTRRDLSRALEKGINYSLAAAGVAVSAYTIWIIAEILSYALFGALIAI